MITRRLRTLSTIAAFGAVSLLVGCGAALVESPTYSVSEVESFKVSGAPNDVMMLDVVDTNNTLPDLVWTNALSNHGFPPRLTFVTDVNDVADTQTIKPENRVVAVVNPTQSTMNGTICTSPQSAERDGTSDRMNVRLGFCVGDKIISETRVHFVKDEFETQLVDTAGTIINQLFPHNLRDQNNDRCGRMKPGC